MLYAQIGRKLRMEKNKKTNRREGIRMKTIKRRLLSVLMVMAIVCTLIPTALAAGGSLSLGLGQSTTLTAEFSEGGFALINKFL